MAFLFFIDETGQDHRESPYEVRCAVGIHDSRLWDLTFALVDAELRQFGVHYWSAPHEFKARDLLQRRTFRLARQLPAFDIDERRHLAREVLTRTARTTRRNLTALGQARLAFCSDVLEICAAHDVAYFASIVHPKAPVSARGALRKDYSSLFRRLFYFLEQQDASERGLLVMDEIGGHDGHRLWRHMRAYFRHTGFGRQQRHRMVPQPVFVHSELTSGVQVADIVAYVLSWNVRLRGMDRPARRELDWLGRLVSARYRRYPAPDRADEQSNFVYFDDLRTRYEKDRESSRTSTQPALAAAGISPN